MRTIESLTVAKSRDLKFELSDKKSSITIQEGDDEAIMPECRLAMFLE